MPTTLLPRTISLHFLMQKGLEVKTMRFYDPEGGGINPRDTPATLRLKDGDEIHVYMEQVGD